MTQTSERCDRETRSTKDGTDKHRHIYTDWPGSTTAHNSTRQATGGLHSAAEEARRASRNNGIVESRLAFEQQATVETRGVREVGLERDVRRENITCASGAELGSSHGGLEEEEYEIGILICRDVGNECSGGVGGVST